MQDNAPDTGPVCTFLVGVNNDRTLVVKGYDKRGGLEYDWGGNTEFGSYTRTPLKNRKAIPILWFRKEAIKISQSDIFVNCISDADSMSKSLDRAVHYLDLALKQWPGLPVFNDPRKVAGTRRDRIYQQFHGLPGIEIPKIVRFQPKNRADVLATAEKEGFTYPVIVRRCGSHNSRDMVLLKSAGHANDLDCLAFDGAFFYITQFVDYKNAEGLYSKTRFVVIGGNIYPRHMLISSQWKISGTSSRKDRMEGSPVLRELERQTLAALEQKIAPAALESVRKIYRDVGLDYLGFDCHILPDGRLLVFEINAAMNAMVDSDYATYPYLKEYVEKMTAGYNAALTGKIDGYELRRRA